MIELVPIKIKVTKNEKGFFNYPKFKTELDFFKRNPHYKGNPLYYDKTSDCSIDSDYSPSGMRWCMKMVPVEFAEEAIEKYPGIVFEMTEEDAEEFYDNKAMAHQSENKYDITTLQGLQIELDLRERLGQSTDDLRAKIERALDPDDNEPGVRRNKGIKWKKMIGEMNIKVIKSRKRS